MAGRGDIEEGKVDESVSVVVEHGPRSTVEQWKLRRLDSPMPRKCCIFRVPVVIRRQQKEAYEPDIVSIGPFHRELFRKAADDKLQDPEDPIFNVPCMLDYLYHDLLLLENQLPWSVLEFFYELIESNNPGKSLSELVIDFFKQSVAYPPTIFSYPKAKPYHTDHILDLIRTSLVQELQVQSQQPSNTNKVDKNHLPQRIPSAAVLSEAGVIFKKKEGESVCILDIKFEKGVFTIPPLAIDERTGPMFRNLVAFEQCYFGCKHLITSYAVLMDNLIDRDKDVNFLCEKGILANWLSAEDASKFFNELYNDTTVIGFEYKELCTKVHDYHTNRWNRWREKLKRDYFDTPWSTISFVAAFVLLMLTFVQTVYTVQTYYHPP